MGCGELSAPLGRRRARCTSSPTSWRRRRLIELVRDEPAPPRLTTLHRDVSPNEQCPIRPGSSHQGVDHHVVSAGTDVARLIWPGVIDRVERRPVDHHQGPAQAVSRRTNARSLGRSVAPDAKVTMVSVIGTANTSSARDAGARAVVFDRLPWSDVMDVTRPQGE